MKKLFKVLILTFLCQQAFAQSKMDMQADNITINRPLFINHNSGIAMQFKSPPGFGNQFFFYENNNLAGTMNRFGRSLQFEFDHFIIFDVGLFGSSGRTMIRPNGLETEGFLKSKDLSFTTPNNAQIKPVFVDKQGKLILDNTLTNHYQSYNFTAIQAQDWDDQLIKGSGFAWFNTTNISRTM